MIDKCEIWEAEYRKRRYMKNLSDNELVSRLRDVVDNLVDMNRRGGIYLKLIDSEVEHCILLWCHIREEYNLRFQGYSIGLNMGKYPLNPPNWPYAQKALAILPHIKSLSGNFLIKYGKAEYLKKTFDKGSIQISPATYYKDSSLNPAIRDNELELTIEILPSEAEIVVYDPQIGKDKQKLLPLDNLKMTFLTESNYYVYCLATVYDIRLFEKFEADSCLVIKRPEEFNRRLVLKTREILPGWIDWGRRVSYIDPLTSHGHVDIFFSKHFRYSYQKEYRICWLPPSSVQELPPVSINIGSLSDCAELFTI